MKSMKFISLAALLFVLIFATAGSASAYNGTTTALDPTTLFSGYIVVGFNQTTAHVNDTVLITVTANNNGLVNWSPVKIYAPIPDGLQYVSHIVPDMVRQDYNPLTGIWDVNRIRSDERGLLKTLVIVVKVKPEAAGKTLTATAKFDTLVLEGYDVHMENTEYLADARSAKLTVLSTNDNGTYYSTGNGTCSGTGQGAGISVPTASANIKGGLYNVNKIITLKMSKNGTIYYTKNGTAPTTASTKYTWPINVTSTTTLKFMAVDNTGYNSPVYTEKYIIDKTAPKITSTSPKNYAKGISRTSTIILKFSEKIKKSAAWSKIYIKNLKTGKIVSINKWIKGNTLYIKMTSKRYAYNWYKIYIPASAIKDYASNNLATKCNLNFKTGLY
ncbi:MAG TPA: chitobiase/beta-hexosaminidase C-terminal domain-containing protein [Methanobacterium sp.]|nr:chitobiase/beta-hexosaminidase C-terminal domain-containing protein [Methanobacterium sp.]